MNSLGSLTLSKGNSDLFFFLSLVVFSLHCTRAQNVVKPPRVTPHHHLFSKKKRERWRFTWKHCAFYSVFSSSLLLFFSRKSLSFLLGCFEAVFSNPDWFSLSRSFSPAIERCWQFRRSFLSLSVCVSFSLSLMCDAQNNDIKTNQRTERRKSSRLKFRTLRKRLFCSAKNWRSKGNRNSARKPIS